MFNKIQYTYYIRKKEGVIVLGKVQGLALFDGNDFFPFFMSQKRISWREIRKTVLEGRGSLIAQDELGRSTTLGIPSCLFGLQGKNEFYNLKLRLKKWLIEISPKQIVF